MLKSGNLMGGGPKASPELSDKDRALFLQACLCFSAGQRSEAFLYFSRLSAAFEHPALLFNLALCQTAAGAWAEAQAALEKALRLIPAPGAPSPALSRGGVFKALQELEAGPEGADYLAPMSLELAGLPELARVRALRLLIDVYAASGQWAEVLRLAGGLGREYSNVKSAVERARQEMA